MGVRSIYGCVGCLFEEYFELVLNEKKKKNRNKTSEDKQIEILNKLSANATVYWSHVAIVESAKSIHFRLKVDFLALLIYSIELLTFSTQFKLRSGHNWSSFN